MRFFPRANYVFFSISGFLFSFTHIIGGIEKIFITVSVRVKKAKNVILLKTRYVRFGVVRVCCCARTNIVRAAVFVECISEALKETCACVCLRFMGSRVCFRGGKRDYDYDNDDDNRTNRIVTGNRGRGINEGHQSRTS